MLALTLTLCLILSSGPVYTERQCQHCHNADAANLFAIDSLGILRNLQAINWTDLR